MGSQLYIMAVIDASATSTLCANVLIHLQLLDLLTVKWNKIRPFTA